MTSLRGVLAVAYLAAPGAAPAQAVPPVDGTHLQVYLLTMGPGASVYERFGHNAIWIRDTVARTDAIYNYGMFEFPDSFSGMLGFIGDFAMGRPRYWLGVDSSLDNELFIYQMRGRNLSAQELNLAPAQRADLAERLARNALPGNRYYQYDYFLDNCSTRVRDMLDQVLGGALRRATVDRPTTATFRFHTLRSLTNDPPLWLAIDAGLGPRTDRPIDQWHEMFLPQAVAARMSDLKRIDSTGTSIPVVSRSFTLLTINRYHVAAAPPHWIPGFTAIGAALAVMILLGLRADGYGVLGRVIATTWLAVVGLGGLLLLFLWLCTRHVATYANHNVLFITPLALAVIPSVWSRATPVGWRLRAIHGAVVSVLIGAALLVVPIASPQRNALILALVVPPLLASVWVALRRQRAAEMR